ncbi:MAG: peptidoglycan-binding domain-containing protein [Cyanobacteria bacterium J06627_32]
MKQFAVRSLGWGVAMMALAPLPVLASNQSSANTAAFTAGSSAVARQPIHARTATPQLIAVALSSRSLRQGDQGADVRVLQRYLSRNGLYPFVIDGAYGPETANAVATYQRIRDLPATGIADEETLIDMEFDFLPQAGSTTAAAAPSFSNASGSIGSGSLGPGSTGSDVIALQQRLNDFGIPVFVDGDYGFETQQAVRTYQRVQGLTVTGTADSRTLDSMGFSAPSNRYIAAIIADENQLSSVRQFFPNAFVDRTRSGQFINIGNFNERYPAEARRDAAAARGYNTRVLYRRQGLFR